MDSPRSVAEGDRRPSRFGVPLVCALFFVSGGPAIIYQLLWQRALFAIYGIHVESVAIVVAAFLLGLGLGGLAGGVASRVVRRPLLLFGAAEFAIGAFGWFSLGFFERVGEATRHLSPGPTAVITFGLVVAPTALMGATLPLLVAHLVRSSPNVGRAVGLLMFVNTLGSAAACLVGAFVLFHALGAAASVRLAAVVNLGVGVVALAFALAKRSPRDVDVSAGSDARERAETERTETMRGEPGRARRFAVALLLAFLGGAVSLSHEIVWVRVFSFATGGLAAGFALVLGMFLAGLAVGALAVRGFCRDAAEPRETWRLFARVTAASALVGFALVPAVAWLGQVAHLAYTLPIVVVGAALFGASLPLLGHLGVRPDGAAGAGVGLLVLANILGAASGSLVTGFVLMERLTLSGIALGLAATGLLVAGAVRVATADRRVEQGRALLATAAWLMLVAVAREPLFDRVWERLLMAEPLEDEPVLERVVEGRAGVVAVTRDGDVYGGGVYDGGFSTDLVDDRNGIVRLFLLCGLHPAPRDVLVIGLSSGSWARVLRSLPTVQRLTAVEIDPGYLELIAGREDAASLLTDEKVEIEIDDARNWLVRNPERRFDLVVMNTSFHWRAHASRLLSREFLELMRQHLKPGGIVFYNTTDSPRAQATAAAVFPHVFRCRNFLGASDSPFVPDRERWRKQLLSTVIEGRPVFDPKQPAHVSRLEEVLDELDRVEWGDALRARTTGLRPITDDNMGVEWLHGPDR